MMRISNHLFRPWAMGRLGACLAVAGALFAIAPAVAAPEKPHPGDTVQGIHVHRTGDTPWYRDAGKVMLDTMKAQCGSPEAKERCRVLLKSGVMTPEMKEYCRQTGFSPTILGDPSDIGQTVTDEYFASPAGRSVRIVKTAVLKQAGLCEARVEQEEKRAISEYRVNGFTRYERRMDQRGQPYWIQFEHKFVPGLADMLKTAVDTAQLSGKMTVSAPLGSKTFVPGRPCEIRRVSAGAVEFASCILATGLKFPSHVTFESEVLSAGKTQRVEKFVSFAYDVALSRDLFFPKSGEKVVTQKGARSDPDNPMKRWCAAEKVRTGIDPCADGDE